MAVRWLVPLVKLVLLVLCAPAAVLADSAGDLDSTQLSQVVDAAVTRINDDGTFKRLRDQHGFINAVEVATWCVRHFTRALVLHTHFTRVVDRWRAMAAATLPASATLSTACGAPIDCGSASPAGVRSLGFAPHRR
jgi:hypothetical protein